MRNLLLEWLVGKDFAQFVKGYQPPVGKHNSLPVGSATSWTWGRAGLSELAWAANKFLQGAGTANDPIEVDPPFLKLKPAITRYVMPGWLAAAQVQTSVSSGVIYYVPILVSETTTYTAIGIYVLAASAGTADLRIFSWSNGVPGSLVLSAGTVDTSTTFEKEITISKQLTPGYYFLAVRCTGTPGLRGLDTAQAVVAPTPGISNLSGNLPTNVVLTVSAAYADPAPAPTGAVSAAYAFVYLKET
jgi:hypothetical protein